VLKQLSNVVHETAGLYPAWTGYKPPNRVT